MKPYLDIIEHFGYRAQMKKLNEECFEFLEAVDNYEDMLLFKNVGSGDEKLARDFIVEEAGDILILLTQFIAKYDIKQDEINKHMDYKLNRTLNRIHDGYYDEEDNLKNS